ncbi:MAG: (2Fe-2S)-binding protein [Streptosporangiaceae bacterium]
MVLISTTVDGTLHQQDVEPRLLLVHYLRTTLSRTGTVIGCDTSNCGACTVLLDGLSVKSCTVLAAQADGAEITTVQGLADDELHPVQKAFRENHALQCGYCTAGMIMSAVDLLMDTPDPTEREIRDGLEGNLCRCTGYHNIIKAVRAAAAEMRAEATAGGEAMPDGEKAPEGHRPEDVLMRAGATSGSGATVRAYQSGQSEKYRS